MITEDYVSFEVAKLLKEKEFDEPCKVWYAECTSVWGGDPSGDRKYIIIQFDDKNRFDEYYKFLCYAPTLQMAMKWLRDEHSIHFFVKYFGSLGLAFTIQKLDSESEHTIGEFYTSYEKACEAAIKYCLENLI